MGLSWPHILIVVLLFILLFGRGKISDLMGDVAKGIKSFKDGLADINNDDSAKSSQAASNQASAQAKSIEHEPGVTIDAKRAGEERKTG
jgi:sec-independent protein translocase protein TatA